MSGIFEFKQCITLLKATGRTAKTLRELRDLITSVSAESILHHTHQYFLKGHVLEYTNDFAHWAGKSLEESALAERLSNIDPYSSKDISQLRTELLKAVDGYLEEFPEPREALPRDEFYFNETVTLIFSAGVRAKSLAEFLAAIKQVDGSSLYYHFYDARWRLGVKADDFSHWFSNGLGKNRLAEKIRRIDPFMHNLEGIRKLIVEAVEAEVKRNSNSREKR
jgi:hypothetical protein